MSINYKQYLEPEYYGTALEAVAEELDSLYVQLSWASDYQQHSLAYAIELKELDLLNLLK